jgi:hypothetical protein
MVTNEQGGTCYDWNHDTYEESCYYQQTPTNTILRNSVDAWNTTRQQHDEVMEDGQSRSLRYLSLLLYIANHIYLTNLTHPMIFLGATTTSATSRSKMPLRTYSTLPNTLSLPRSRGPTIASSRRINPGKTRSFKKVRFNPMRPHKVQELLPGRILWKIGSASPIDMSSFGILLRAGGGMVRSLRRSTRSEMKVDE